MVNVLLLGLGGFLGAIFRYWVAGRIQDLSGSIGFPYGTLVVNILGCFVLGLLTYLIDARGLLNPEIARLPGSGSAGSIYDLFHV